jgi:hypothetical protein
MQPQQQEKKWGMGDTFNALYAVAVLQSTAVTPFLRTNFGVEALGFPGIWAFVLLLAWAGLSGDPMMLGYLVAWLFAVACQRVRTARLVRQGWVAHSQYTGWPRLALRVPFVRKETTAKGVIEPLLCLALGVVLGAIAEAHQRPFTLPAFFLVSSFCLAFREKVNREVERKRVQAMRDAQIDQQWLAEQFHRQGEP